MSLRLCIVAALLAFPVPAADESAAVLRTVQRFFDAIASRDAVAAAELVVPEGQYLSVREGKPPAAPSTLKAFAERLAAGKEKLLERMWKPQVLVDGSIAAVWTPYDFHRDGKFSHCGTDSFQLLKTAAGWKIWSAAWTVQTAGCQESPLGPPKP
jgi:ketosteroid isomerase-like protein